MRRSAETSRGRRDEDMHCRLRERTGSWVGELDEPNQTSLADQRSGRLEQQLRHPECGPTVMLQSLTLASRWSTLSIVDFDHYRSKDCDRIEAKLVETGVRQPDCRRHRSRAVGTISRLGNLLLSTAVRLARHRVDACSSPRSRQSIRRPQLISAADAFSCLWDDGMPRAVRMAIGSISPTTHGPGAQPSNRLSRQRIPV
jgi:hypothetical protein